MSIIRLPLAELIGIPAPMAAATAMRDGVTHLLMFKSSANGWSQVGDFEIGDSPLNMIVTSEDNG